MHDSIKPKSVFKVLQGQCYHFIDTIPGLWKKKVGVEHLSNVLVSEHTSTPASQLQITGFLCQCEIFVLYV